MRTETFTRIAMIVLSLMILLGAIVSFCMISAMGDSNNIKVELTRGEPETISFTNPDLEDRKEEYTVSLVSEDEGEYRVSFSFLETKKNKHRDDIYAKITVGGETVCDKSLAELFDGSAISFTCNLAKKESADVTVEYYIPEGTSVNTEDSEIDFDINIVANN